MKIHWPHRLWCNCEPCIRGRGGYVIPDWKVEALEAKLRAADTRPPMPYLFDPLTPPVLFGDQRIMFDPPLEGRHVNAIARATSSLTPEDVRFLKALKIDPR